MQAIARTVLAHGAGPCASTVRHDGPNAALALARYLHNYVHQHST